MPYSRVHSKRLGVDLAPYSVGINGVFLVESIGFHAVHEEPEKCWLCSEMTMDGYTLKLNGTDTTNTGNASPFSYIIRTCHKCGIAVLEKFSVGPW